MTLNTWHHAWLTDEDTGRKLRQYHNNKVIQLAFKMKGVRSRRGRGGRGEDDTPSSRESRAVVDLIHITDSLQWSIRVF